MEILNEDRFTCRATNNAIFALAMSLYLSSTQIIIAATRNEEMYIRLFYCRVRKMHAQSTYRPVSLRRPTHTHMHLCIFLRMQQRYIAIILRERKLTSSQLHSC